MRRPVAAALLAVAAIACGSGPGTTSAPTTGGEAAPAAGPPGDTGTGASTSTRPRVADLIPGSGPVRLVPEVVATVPHDPDAFTQGLEYHDGVLLESTGRYGRSDRRRVDPATGDVLDVAHLPPAHFGEGLTVVGDRLVQLTWREGVAHVADPATLDATGALPLEGEGWGLCYDGRRVFHSDGTSTLRVLDPDTFEVTGRVEVTSEGAPVDRLNELECADGLVWANRWMLPEIVAIDPDSGEVRATVDAAALVPEGMQGDAVLNGIARNPDGDTFWLTGKLWPVLYEVRLAQVR